jgi:hypothetical protein
MMVFACALLHACCIEAWKGQKRVMFFYHSVMTNLEFEDVFLYSNWSKMMAFSVLGENAKSA